MRRTAHWWIAAVGALGLACPGGTGVGTDAGSGSDASSGADAGTTDSGTNGNDAGQSDAGQTDAGGLYCNRATEPTVTIDIPATCTGFAPCGGDPAGTWHYTAVCVADPFGAIRQACSAMTTSATFGTASGCAVFSGGASGFVYRDLAWTISGTVHLPASCTPTGCAQAQTALDVYFPGSTCTASGAGGCDCMVARAGSTIGKTDYTVSGTTLEISQASRTFDLCVAPGVSLDHHEATASGAEPGFWTMVPN